MFVAFATSNWNRNNFRRRSDRLAAGRLRGSNKQHRAGYGGKTNTHEPSTAILGRLALLSFALRQLYPPDNMTMDEYIEQLSAEMPESTLKGVVRNILDEPIPETVKSRLLNPLLPGGGGGLV